MTPAPSNNVGQATINGLVAIPTLGGIGLAALTLLLAASAAVALRRQRRA